MTKMLFAKDDDVIKTVPVPTANSKRLTGTLESVDTCFR